MKIQKYFFLVAVLALAMVGCKKPIDVSFGTATQEVAAEGATVEVALRSNGEWTLEWAEEWLDITPRSGNGNATLTLVAAPNMTNGERSVEITATTKDNTASLKVTQTAMEYYVNATPQSITCPSAGGEYTINVSSNIEWTVVTPQWITSSVTSGANDATLTLTVSPMGDEFLGDRQGEVFIGSLISVSTRVVVVQLADPVLPISLDPSNLYFVSEGETKNVNVTTEDQWTAVADADWVVLSQTEGQGDAEVSVTLGENPIYIERQALVTFTTAAGLTATLSLRQEASIDPHFLEVAPQSFAFGKEGGEQNFTIGCDTDWEISFSVDWLTTTPQTGTGNATVTMSVAANTVEEPRSARVLVKSGVLFTELVVEQEAGTDPLVASFEPETLEVDYSGGFVYANLTSNTSWVLEASDWIYVQNGTLGQGDASITMIVDNNLNPEGRTGFVNALHNGEVLASMTVIQEGMPNILEVDVTEIEARPEGGDYTIHVTANQAWNINVDADWLGCTPTSGFGNGEFVITAKPMTGVMPRSGRVKLVGSMGAQVIITVVQHQ